MKERKSNPRSTTWLFYKNDSTFYVRGYIDTERTTPRSRYRYCFRYDKAKGKQGHGSGESQDIVVAKCALLWAAHLEGVSEEGLYQLNKKLGPVLHSDPDRVARLVKEYEQSLRVPEPKPEKEPTPAVEVPAAVPSASVTVTLPELLRALGDKYRAVVQSSEAAVQAGQKAGDVLWQSKLAAEVNTAREEGFQQGKEASRRALAAHLAARA